MRKTATLAAIVGCSLAGLAFGQARDGGTAGAGNSELDTVRVAFGLSLPVFVTAPPGDTERLFIVEQRSGSTGRIKILNLKTGTVNTTPFLSISPVSTGSEQGLLGLAFHPDYANNGYFYVNYTNPTTRIARYKVSDSAPDVADPNSGTILLSISQPESNHNGGWIGFGPDGYLYIATGDGGGANDQHSSAQCPTGNAQCVNTLLGKILRIDVDGADNIPGNDDDDGIIGNGSTGGYTSPETNPYAGATPGMDEIWHIGLRNPWRCSFDRETGDLYIGDVGQNAREEISFQPANTSTGGPGTHGYQGGKNFGWRCMEGLLCTGLSGCTCNALSLTNPIHTHNWTPGAAVTGGYVYRGSAIPDLQGTYFFADYGQGNIWSFRYVNGVVTEFQNRNAELAPGGGLSISSIASFGEDGNGELYICDRSGGEIFKIQHLGPANNTCVTALLVEDGSTPFSSVNATTDGPAEPGDCDADGDDQISNDVWFKWVASCTGTATASVCGANFNTKMAAYAACPTSEGEALACNDDFCGTASEISFPVVAGTLYRIRVGGSNGATGSGTLVINCNEEKTCPPDINNSGAVDVADLLAVISAWGPCDGKCPADINNSGTVDVADLLSVISGWGPCP